MQMSDPMAKYMAAKNNEAKQGAHKRDEAAKKKAVKEVAKLARRRQKDVKAAARKSEAVALEKMNKLKARTERNLERLDKMQKGIAARKRKLTDNLGQPKEAKKGPVKKGSKEEIARRQQTEAALARIIESPAEEVSDTEDEQAEIEAEPEALRPKRDKRAPAKYRVQEG